MKNIKKHALKIGRVFCMLAMFVAIHSANVMCTGKYYQPEAPEGLEKFKKF